jgi:hypothetical protein
MREFWYELRVAGSMGTSEGRTDHGITLDEQGRLCAISTGKAKRFKSREEADDFLSGLTFTRFYSFEPVLCNS